MNPVSFGSTYKISSAHNKNHEHLGDVMNLCYENGFEYYLKSEVKDTKGNGFNVPHHNVSSIIIAPDERDNLVEAFLLNKGIKFKKLNTKELLNKSNITSRIDKAPKDKKLVMVDSKKLEELISNQDTNIDYCKETYNKYYKDNVEIMVKSGEYIPATTLHISSMGTNAEDEVSYIKKFGADRLNDGQLSFMFVQNTNDPDHCMYFGLKDLGMDKIPVYVDKDSLAIGNALGIFK